MKYEEMNEIEMTEVNGGFLGLRSFSNGNNSNASNFAGLGNAEIGFSSTSTNSNGSSESTSFGLSLSNLLRFQNASQN